MTRPRRTQTAVAATPGPSGRRAEQQGASASASVAPAGSEGDRCTDRSAACGRADQGGAVIRVAAVDDHPIFLDGLLRTLDSAPDFAIVGSGASAADAIRIATTCSPDVFVLNMLANATGTAADAVEGIASCAPAIRMLILTAMADDDRSLAAMRGGTRVIVPNDISGADLIRIVRTVHQGGYYVAPSLLARLLARYGRPAGAGIAAQSVPAMLSFRERQILTLLAKGCSNKEIGLQLTLSDKTIKHYVTGLLHKLRVRNRTQAAMVACHWPFRETAGESAD